MRAGTLRPTISLYATILKLSKSASSSSSLSKMLSFICFVGWTSVSSYLAWEGGNNVPLLGPASGFPFAKRASRVFLNCPPATSECLCS